jgi:hypothetical protein
LLPVPVDVALLPVPFAEEDAALLPVSFPLYRTACPSALSAPAMIRTVAPSRCSWLGRQLPMASSITSRMLSSRTHPRGDAPSGPSTNAPAASRGPGSVISARTDAEGSAVTIVSTPPRWGSRSTRRAQPRNASEAESERPSVVQTIVVARGDGRSSGGGSHCAWATRRRGACAPGCARCSLFIEPSSQVYRKHPTRNMRRRCGSNHTLRRRRRRRRWSQRGTTQHGERSYTASRAFSCERARAFRSRRHRGGASRFGVEIVSVP